MARLQAVGPCIPAVSIVGIGTALPPRRLSQADAWAWALDHIPLTPATRELYERVLGDPSIATRHLALDDLSELLETNHDTVIARFGRRAGELSARSLARALELPAAALEAARAVLHDVGNLSSPTVLFVLDEEQRRRPPAPGDLGILSAFGAGFAAHAALVEY